MKRNAQYYLWIDTLASGLMLIIALLFFWAFNRYQVPHLLVFTGWFLRSAIWRAKRGEDKVKDLFREN